MSPITWAVVLEEVSSWCSISTDGESTVGEARSLTGGALPGVELEPTVCIPLFSASYNRFVCEENRLLGLLEGVGGYLKLVPVVLIYSSL